MLFLRGHLYRVLLLMVVVSHPSLGWKGLWIGAHLLRVAHRMAHCCRDTEMFEGFDGEMKQSTDDAAAEAG